MLMANRNEHSFEMLRWRLDVFSFDFFDRINLAYQIYLVSWPETWRSIYGRYLKIAWPFQCRNDKIGLCPFWWFPERKDSESHLERNRWKEWDELKRIDIDMEFHKKQERVLYLWWDSGFISMRCWPLFYGIFFFFCPWWYLRICLTINIIL